MLLQYFLLSVLNDMNLLLTNGTPFLFIKTLRKSNSFVYNTKSGIATLLSKIQKEETTKQIYVCLNIIQS